MSESLKILEVCLLTRAIAIDLQKCFDKTERKSTIREMRTDWCFVITFQNSVHCYSWLYQQIHMWMILAWFYKVKISLGLRIFKYLQLIYQWCKLCFLNYLFLYCPTWNSFRIFVSYFFCKLRKRLNITYFNMYVQQKK